MRGQDHTHELIEGVPRITPADAGTRDSLMERLTAVEDHPRGCGDKQNAYTEDEWNGGSPPRMRGQGHDWVVPFKGVRITPADAGTSDSHLYIIWIHWDHPRGCGDKYLMQLSLR